MQPVTEYIQDGVVFESHHFCFAIKFAKSIKK
jgi:hypothetical protein